MHRHAKTRPGPINPQIMIAVRLRPWDLRLATGPITYPPPYRRICVAGRANLLTDNVYAADITSFVERVHGFMKQEGKTGRIDAAPFDRIFFESFPSNSNASRFRRREDYDRKLSYRAIYEKWNVKWEKVWIRCVRFFKASSCFDN